MTKLRQSALLGLLAAAPLSGYACNQVTDHSSLETCGGAGALSIAPSAYPVPSASSSSMAYAINGAINGSWCGVQSVSVLQAFSAAPIGSAGYAFWSAQVPLSALESLAPCGDASGHGVEVTAQAIVYDNPLDGGPPDAGPTLTVTGSQCVAFSRVLGSTTCAFPTTSFSLPDGTPAIALPVAPGPGRQFEVFASDPSLIGRPVTWKSVGGLVSPVPLSPVLVQADGGGLGSDAGCAASTIASALVTPGSTSGIDTVTASIDGFGAPAAAWNVALQGPAKLSVVPATLVAGGPTLLTVQNPMGFTQTCNFSVPGGISVADISAATDAGGDAEAGAVLPPDGGTSSFSAALKTYAFTFALGDAGVPSAAAIVECYDQFSQIATTTIPSTNSAGDGGASDARASDAGASDAGGGAG